MSSPVLSPSDDGEYCVICQAIMLNSDVQTAAIQQQTQQSTLLEMLKYTNASPLLFIHLSCSHTFHRSCLIKWVHYNNTSCPLCRNPINLANLSNCTWKVQNIAVRTKCSPESVRLGMKPEGWFNVQIQVNPPNNEKLKNIRYYFHPAFSLNKLELRKQPFDLVMKLVSNSVEIVIEAETISGEKFTFLHQICKEMCVRAYYQDIYNGTDEGCQLEPIQYFKNQLETYNRESDYYEVEMPVPVRFQGAQDRERTIFTRLLGFFQG
ncbi:Ribonuclease [Spironucleus salmonicida]|uniref:RING finger-containing protein n=1 Tax=Spironucleus salmonicida TaxID=348837 RepID=V6LW04_9EUKA|nr:Ribonuclease [Spironucleus salmonicida]|eukprot:EST44999.1 RING finger-containing protein [Spironucleus salmonicida]